jgi:hypothetical protein
MALVVFLSSLVRLSELIEYSSLYTFGTLLCLSIGFTLYLCHYNCVASLPEKCSVGIFLTTLLEIVIPAMAPEMVLVYLWLQN